MASDPNRSAAPRCALRLLTLVLCGVLLPSCTYLSGRTDFFVSSQPAGASVFVDGVDTGQTTPVMLDMADYAFVSGYLAGDHEISVRKSGFEPEKRTLYHHTAHYTSKWIDGAAGDYYPLPLPLFWTFGDWFTPFGIQWQFTPRELHMKLYPIGEAPGVARTAN